MHKFNVTYEVYTEKDAEHGDTDKRGFVSFDECLRDAIEDLGWPENNPYQPSSYPGNDFRWITSYNTNKDWTKDETENRSLHIPDGITAASRGRILRYLNDR